MMLIKQHVLDNTHSSMLYLDNRTHGPSHTHTHTHIYIYPIYMHHIQAFTSHHVAPRAKHSVGNNDAYLARMLM